MVEIVEITNRDRERWMRAPYRFYDDLDAHRPVPEVFLKELISRGGTIAESVDEPSFFLAADADEPLGRIAFFVAPGEGARFGFFEVAPRADASVAEALLDTAAERASGLGFDTMMGPISVHPIISAGQMSSMFDRTAPLFMDHGRPEYPDYLRDYGPSETSTMRTWLWDAERLVPAAARQIATATRAHPGLELRPVERRDFVRRDAAVIAELYNDAYVDTWGFQPLEPATIDAILRGGDLVDTDCSFFAEIDGEPAALALALPNVNTVGLTAAEHDRPWGPFHERLRQAFISPDSFRLFIFLVRQAYRGRAVGGLATMMWHEFDVRARTAGYSRGETPLVPALDEHRSNALASLGLRPGRPLELYTYEVGAP